MSGEPTAIAENIIESGSTWEAVFSSSQNGVLAYQSGELAQNELRWYDRDGRKLGTLGSGTYAELRLSPDGTRLAVDFGNPSREVWIFDLRRDVKTRLTFGGMDFGPVWSPDGTRIVFSGRSTRAGSGIDIVEQKEATIGRPVRNHPKAIGHVKRLSLTFAIRFLL